MEYSDYLEIQNGNTEVPGELSFHMKFENRLIGFYHRQTVMNGMCDGFLSMRFIADDRNTDVYYNTGNYVLLKVYCRKNMIFRMNVLEIIEEVLYAIGKCGEYLVFEEELPLDIEHIYIDPDSGKIKLVYVPGYFSDEKISVRVMRLIDRFVELSGADSESLHAFDGYRISVMKCSGRAEDVLEITQNYMERLRISSMGEETGCDSESHALKNSSHGGKRTSRRDGDVKNRAKELFIKLIT